MLAELLMAAALASAMERGRLARKPPGVSPGGELLQRTAARDEPRLAGGTPALPAGVDTRSGRTIYHHGTGSSPITATINAARIDAATVPCASCHGADGRGKPEGGAAPPDIRRAMLTKPYEVAAAGGRRRAPYDDRLLRRAITMGIDSSGNQLSNVMPRYQMTRADVDALVAFLHTLGDETAPGVTDTTIRAGVLLPPAPRGDAVRAAVESWAKELNASGGVYGRMIEVRFGADEDVFVRFASFTDGAHASDIPTLSAFSSEPDPDASNVRYLLAGIPQQARALARFAASRGTDRPVAVVRAPGLPPIADRAAAAFTEEARAAGFPSGDGPPAAVLVLGNVPTLPPAPLILRIASLGGAAAFDQHGGTQAVAFPVLARDLTRIPSGFVPGHGLDQLQVIASARLFVAALQASGTDLTRERFLAAVDSMTAFDTGLTPPLTYRGNRRTGAGGVWVVTVGAGGGGEEWVKVE